jgi:hypothetical protein
MCTVAEICSTGVRVTLSDVPEVLLTATNSEPQVQDAGLAAKAGTYSTTASVLPMPFLFSARTARGPASTIQARLRLIGMRGRARPV